MTVTEGGSSRKVMKKKEIRQVPKGIAVLISVMGWSYSSFVSGNILYD